MTPLNPAPAAAFLPATQGSNDLIAPCLSVVMPAYNEERSLDEIIELVLAQRPVQELIVVDDCSKDATWAKLQAWQARDSRVRVFHHEVNQGKGAALRTGLGHASAPYVIIQDADLEYDPTEYHLLLHPLLANRADVVFGSRFAGGPRRVLHYWHAMGNIALTTLSNMCTNLWLTDMETCYKVLRRDVVQRLQLVENRFGFEPEITAKIARLNVRVFEVPISYYGRTYADGKKIGWKDGFSAIRCILKYSLFTP
jgi:glycosyltransferase involved in cell wall biosynthesis